MGRWGCKFEGYKGEFIKVDRIVWLWFCVFLIFVFIMVIFGILYFCEDFCGYVGFFKIIGDIFYIL